MVIRPDEVMIVNGRLTQVGAAFRVRTKTGHAVHAVFVCQCGSSNAYFVGAVKASKTMSCGCLKSETIVIRCTKHGHTVKEHSRTYSSWKSMKNRCTNERLACWPRYGGRGISVCESWFRSFETFLSDMGERPQGTSIDRVNNDGNYEKSNCRWATRAEQGSNSDRPQSKMLEYGGLTMCLTAWDRHLGFREETVRKRLKAGWSVERALTTPIRTKLEGT